jgi:hypothetical protein
MGTRGTTRGFGKDNKEHQEGWKGLRKKNHSFFFQVMRNNGDDSR